MFNPLALVSSIMHTISCKILNETGNNATRYNQEMPVLEYRAACYPYPDIATAMFGKLLQATVERH